MHVLYSLKVKGISVLTLLTTHLLAALCHMAGANAGFFKGGGSNLGLHTKGGWVGGGGGGVQGVQRWAQCYKAYILHGQKRGGGGSDSRTPLPGSATAMGPCI